MPEVLGMALGRPNWMLRNRGTMPWISGVGGGQYPQLPAGQKGEQQQLVPVPPPEAMAVAEGEEKGVFPTGILGRNGEVEVLDSGGATPLMLACHQGNPQLGVWTYAVFKLWGDVDRWYVWMGPDSHLTDP